MQKLGITASAEGEYERVRGLQVRVEGVIVEIEVGESLRLRIRRTAAALIHSLYRWFGPAEVVQFGVRTWAMGIQALRPRTRGGR